MGGCCGGGIPACEHVFDDKTARDDLRALRRDGPPWATRTLVDALADGLSLDGLTVVDIGAGVGAVHLALLERGAQCAVDLDGSSASVAAAREEADRRGVADRVSYLVGDATALAATLEPADLVALDRVVCCYADAPALMATAAGLARRRIGFVFPRDTWWARAAVTLANPVMFRGSAGYRMRIHPAAAVTAPLAAAGFVPRARVDGRLWRVETWERSMPGDAPA